MMDEGEHFTEFTSVW